MSALRLRCWGVMSAAVVMDYLRDEGGECFPDLRLELGREATPDGGGLDGHNTSHWAASATRALMAEKVSLVRAPGGVAPRLVAATGMRKRISSR
jgi:hypothetical protein